jgi:anti-anti-sigma factor
MRPGESTTIANEWVPGSVEDDVARVTDGATPAAVPAAVHTLRVASPELDRAAAVSLQDDLHRALAGGASALILDLAAVERFDPIGLSVLLLAQQEAPAGVRVVIAALRPAGQTIARAMRLHEVFDIYASVQAAETDLAG